MKEDNEIIINNILFQGENLDLTELTSLAEAYYKKLDDIVQFMIEHDEYHYFGNRLAKEIKVAIGPPIIDVDTKQIKYLNHTIDQSHIISIEYSGMIEKLFYFSIDG